MLRDFKFLRRNSGKNPNPEEIENVPVNPSDSSAPQSIGDSSRPPLNAIQEPKRNPNADKTPTKAKSRYSDGGIQLRTPEKRGVPANNKFGWAQKNDSSSNGVESRDEGKVDFGNQYNRGNLYTPRSNRGTGRANSCYSESNSTQCTPTKSVTKPPNPGLCLTGGSRPPPASGGARMANFTALSKGVPISCSSMTVVNTVEVPHFDLKEDPSFWMDHNIQVLIRIRPLNSMERNTNGYNRCLKQENAQCVTWIGQPETRFTFDHVACETVDQETLFRMVGLQMVENCLSGYNSCMFAYGQTGSGKTYTMLGEIDELEVRPSLNRGMTPRIFEFLFARIRGEEESRRDERLKYYCKCSFLEIYNEQITDLLDPSSTNLLLREDSKKGVYVENLSEFEVETVGDILRLLSQGSSNRKVAATNMNRESSRSHSVFTCVIESRWEKDSTSNLRFARLNLVDLAGSERQKSSGAEGERLKEAANINKSLSTLGHVIMVLVDVANAKQRHIPYRDSRLTFLLQDSLGGNSKTMIIANVSPCICSAAETLNTLKFAQRAKLIQNNAVVNEDSSGDVTALQYQIRLLKEEISALKRQNVSRSLSFGATMNGATWHEDERTDDIHDSLRISSKQLKSLESTLTGALRREQMAETSIKQVEAELEQSNRLVRQREEDSRCSKMMLKFREDKIQRMESLVNGLIPADNYLQDENKALSEEIHLLRAKVDRNPEVTRFALENIRLLEQLRRFQDFYEEGEREMLLNEVSELRDQLASFLAGNSEQHNIENIEDVVHTDKENEYLHLELKKTLDDLEECRNNLNSCLENNAKLSREIDDLRASVKNISSATPDYDGSIEVIKESILEAPSFDDLPFEAVQKDQEENLTKHVDEQTDLQLELDILKVIIEEERSARSEIEEKVFCLTKNLESAEGNLLAIKKNYEDVKEELIEAKSIIEALESQQLISISEIEELRNKHEIQDLPSEDSPLQVKLRKMQDSLEKAKRLNVWYQSDRTFNASNEEEMDEVRKQVEAETAEVIVCLQEELSVLQDQVHESNSKEKESEVKIAFMQNEINELKEELDSMKRSNEVLIEKLEEKEKESKLLSDEWELLTSEIEVVDEVLKGASNQKINSISEKMRKMARRVSEKELIIEELRRCLEDADGKRIDLESMLMSLRGAVLVITETHQQDCKEKEDTITHLTSQLSEFKIKIKRLEEETREVSNCATVAFVIVNRLSELNCEFQEMNVRKDEICSKLEAQLSEEKKRACAMELKLEEIEKINILNAKEQITQLKTGVSNLELSVNEYVDQFESQEKDSAADGHKLRTGRGENQLIENVDSKILEENLACERALKGSNNKESTIVLLKKEIESALESLRGVQVEMAKLRDEKEQVSKSEKQSRQSIVSVISLLLALQATMDNFEEEIERKMVFLDEKLQKVEGITQESAGWWFQEKKLYELELGEAQIVATEKTAESSCILAKFEEAQETMKEADIIINKLLISNETMKIEIQRLKMKESDDAIIKDQHIQTLENHYESEITEMKTIILELEDIVSQIQTTFNHDFLSLSSDFLDMKSQLHESNSFIRTGLEEIWSEIIVKDCALSVLHLCHMGILLETVTGLNVENGFLHNGICESNSVITELREHNCKSRKELEMCRILKGKLLNDIKNSFDRISKKDDETGEFAFKLTGFEKKILDLEIQEESMLKRSNYMGSELNLLMKEFNSSNKNLLVSLLDQENLLKEKEEKFAVELFEKDLELLVLVKELEQLAAKNADVDKNQICFHTMFEDIKKDLVILKFDAEIKDFILLEKESEFSDMRELIKEFEQLLEDAKMKESALQNEIGLLGGSLAKLQSELEIKDSDLMKMNSLEEDLKRKTGHLEADHCIILQDLEEKKSENFTLQKTIISLDNCIANLQSRQSVLKEELLAKTHDLEIHVDKVLNKESIAVEKMFREMHESLGTTSKFIKELESLGNLFEVIICENSSLRTELGRKEKVLEGLLFDLSLLQESASKTQDQKAETEELLVSVHALENELTIRSQKFDEVVAKAQILESQLQEKIDIISTLELDLSKERFTVNSLTSKNLEFIADIEKALNAKKSVEKDLQEKMKGNESLEMVIFNLDRALESSKSKLESFTRERDELYAEIVFLKKELEIAQALAQENETIAMEAQQVAETAKQYADDKEEEVRLLERSVEELECTLDVLESKADIVKGEAERQRLQREELELELQAVKQQLLNVKSNCDDEMKRHLDEKEKNLQESLNRIQILERELTAKDAEIAQCKSHISELNLHAEAQACEYKQKFKALEAMADQVKPEMPAVQISNSSTNKLEKNGSKSRGSGSPFKCIGLGIAQQIKSERDEEISAGKQRIEELEALAANRQKEIFMLNARLATAESMTHDVIRDLLGLKLDMTNYASLMDNQQVQKLAEKAKLHNAEAQTKDDEVIKLKQQLNAFVQERKGWLEEIERKQAEMVAAQIALEQLRQRDRLLTTENEMFKTENITHKKRVMELETELKKLSGQQNLQQRIHHHAKIKEQNNLLMVQNEELSVKLRRTEGILSRVRQELANFRTANGKSPFINFDEEQRLNDKLQESEGERMQLAQKLVGLCTSILKAAGVTRPVSEINVSVAEESLEQIKNRVVSLERELKDAKFENRISHERIRLSELKPKSSPKSADENRTPNILSQTPFLSILDR